MSNFPQRGEVWLVNFEANVGSEQGGTRPVVILQNDLGNKYSPTTIVAPMTTPLREMPVHVLLEQSHGVERPAMLLLEQIHTIDKKRLVKKLGKISESKWGQILEAILYSLGFKIL